MKLIKIVSLLIALIVVAACQKNEKQPEMKQESVISKRLAAFAQVNISTDLSQLTDNQKKMVELLAEAGKIADEIFWKQNSHDGIALRDSLSKLDTPEAKEMFRYLSLWYGPYDAMYDEERFVGNGAKTRPGVGNFYPQDLTKQEFEDYIKKFPDEAAALESQYTIVVRDGAKLKAIPYHEAYPEMLKMADLLDQASNYCDNPSFKNYLVLRAKALRTGDYYESDMAWMDIKDSEIDLVIGPIENYADAMFNYKTAFECVVMVKDKEATKELEMYESNIDFFEHNLPYDKKYIRPSAGKGNILQIVNVAYFGGDCNAGTKTIAASLPNDPKVHEAKGGKKSMYKNIMEAKFDKILVPIAKKIMADDLIPYCDKKSFTSFVTLHEVSHTLGRGYVFGNDKLQVRKALQEKYSAIEELKADLLGMYNHKHLLAKGLINEDVLKKTIATYIPGLYRSIRFGAEEAHGKANVMQLNYLTEKGAILFDKNGKLTYDPAKFMDVIGEFAGLVLTIQAQGDYKAAGDLMDKYGKMSDNTKKIIETLSDVSRDIDNRK
jgi:hypothetical protein